VIDVVARGWKRGFKETIFSHLIVRDDRDWKICIVRKPEEV
jgi:hypothetical protein